MLTVFTALPFRLDRRAVDDGLCCRRAQAMDDRQGIHDVEVPHAGISTATRGFDGEFDNVGRFAVLAARKYTRCDGHAVRPLVQSNGFQSRHYSITPCSRADATTLLMVSLSISIGIPCIFSMALL